MDFNDKEIKKFELRDGDLLVCEGGEIGRCAIWRSQLGDCYYQKALHRVRLNNKLTTPEYIQEYFYWMAERGGLSSSVNEVTFKHLTAEKMNKLLVPVPPLKLQEKYTEIYKSIDRKLEDNRELLVELDANFTGLMQKAFCGELKIKNKAA